MSFDIVVATRKPATRAMVESHLRAVGWRLSLKGDLAAHANLVAESRGLLRRKYSFTLGGSNPAENDDFPAAVQQQIRGRGFLLEMNLPWGLPEADLHRAFALCEHLARTCEGVVFDPQDNRIVFPDLPDRIARREPVQTPTRQLTLEWFLPESGPVDCSKFISVVRRVWPEAIPARFGSTEPLPFKMAEPDGETRFSDLWEHEKLGLFWQSKRPVFGGSLFRSPDLAEPPGKRRMVDLTIRLSASAIEDDAVLCDRAVELFVTVAEQLRAFIAVGYVTRGVLVGTRGGAWYGRETEKITYTWGPWWIGLPPIPTWLTWFGEPYRALVASSVEAIAVQREQGLLVRLGPSPMDSDQVRGLAPSLPPELLLRFPPDQSDTARTPAELRELLELERSPAAVIPPWD